jgi:trehalose 6-phosphate phosphatase
VAESSRSADGPLSRALGLAVDALAVAPAGILTDFDGTLSPIVADPAAARLVAGADGALADLVRRLAVVAVITGRAPLDARRMTGVPGLLIAGNHGTEWLEPGASLPVASPEAARARAAVAEVVARVPALDGVVVEDKGISASVHYRNAADPDAAHHVLLEAIGSLDPALERRSGRMSIELRPVGLGDKGAAARSVVERFGLRGAIVMGDDLTDLDMFTAVAELRGAGRLRCAVIAVGGGGVEVPAAVTAAADVVLEEPAQAALLLAGIAEALPIS